MRIQAADGHLHPEPGTQGKPFSLERDQLANRARDDPIVAVALGSLPPDLAKQVRTFLIAPPKCFRNGTLSV